MESEPSTNSTAVTNGVYTLASSFLQNFPSAVVDPSQYYVIFDERYATLILRPTITLTLAPIDAEGRMGVAFHFSEEGRRIVHEHGIHYFGRRSNPFFKNWAEYFHAEDNHYLLILEAYISAPPTLSIPEVPQVFLAIH